MTCRIKRQLVEVSSLLPCGASFIDLEQLLMPGAGDHGCRNEEESLARPFTFFFFASLAYFILFCLLC